jgi:glutamate-1-semialdehyde 2,1-aminomutase
MAKILAGGLPGGAVAGRADIIDQIAFAADRGRKRIAHPGTFNANPLSSAAGSTCLRVIAGGEHQERAASTAAQLARAMNRVFAEESVAGCVYGQSSMLHIALGMSMQPPDGYGWGWSALPAPPPRASYDAEAALKRGMLNEGVDLMGMGMMVSSAHTDDDTERTVGAFRGTLRAMKGERLVG